MCLAAFAVVALLASTALGLLLPIWDRVSLALPGSRRVHFWMALAALPGALALFTVGVSFLPALGIGHDHCLTHGPHHPHLCPHHLAEVPGAVLVVLALALAVRGGYLMADFVRSVRLGYATSRALSEASEVSGDVCVFGSSQPNAFVLGTFRSRIHASRGLMALGNHVAGAALAHERAHVRHRHLMWRMLCTLFAAAHLPPVATAIRERLALCQEMLADSEAAQELGDPLRVAESLVALARLGRASAAGLSFTHGDLGARVRALLHPTQPRGPWVGWLLVSVALALFSLVGLCHDPVHHGLETILGALS